MGRFLCGPSWHGPSWFWAELSCTRRSKHCHIVYIEQLQDKELASHEANPIFNRTVFRSVDVRPVFCFIPKIKLFSVFIWINTCDAYIVLSLIKDIYI